MGKFLWSIFVSDELDPQTLLDMFFFFWYLNLNEDKRAGDVVALNWQHLCRIRKERTRAARKCGYVLEKKVIK